MSRRRAPRPPTSPARRERRAYAAWDPRQARGRVLVAVLVGLVTAAALSFLPGALRTVVAWDTAAFALLSISWLVIWRSDADATARRAAADDPGRTLVWLIVLLASVFSVFAAAVVMRSAKGLSPEHSAVLAGACLAAVVIAWLLTHTAYTLRYAHLYYRDEDPGVGGLAFPGDEPPHALDFAYFSFTVGMCFQVSDVTITSRIIRREVLFHSCLSFAYNTAILALALNLAFGLLG